MCVPCGERDRTPRVRDHRVEHRALVALGELLELGARRPRLLDLAGGESNLDVRREQRGALERFPSLCARPADRGERGVALPLREPKLREAGLRLPAQSARLAVRLLRCLELAEQPQHLALTVVREPRHHAHRIEARACESRLLERVVPGAVQLQDLGAMDEAAAREGDEIRLPCCPRGQR